MYIGSFDFGQMLNQPGMPQNQVFGQPVQGGDALGNFMGDLPQVDLSSPSSNSQIDFSSMTGSGGNQGQNFMGNVGSQLTAEFLRNVFQPQPMPEIQPMSPAMVGRAPTLNNPYQGLILGQQPINPLNQGLIGTQPTMPMNPMLGGNNVI
jgi:hypothetical protein